MMRSTHCTLAVMMLLVLACGEETNTSTPEPMDLGTPAQDSMTADAQMDMSSKPEPTAILTNGETQLIIHQDPGVLSLVYGDVERMSIDRAGFLIGTVPSVDPQVNYNPYYIWSQVPTSRPGGLEWLEPETWTISQNESAIRITLQYGEIGELSLEIIPAGNNRFQLRLTSESNAQIAYLRIVKTVSPTEGFYGLGEVFDDVNHRGKVRSMQLEADFSIESVNNEAHVPIPLLLGTSGWGVFYESFYPSVFGVANESEERVDFAVGLGEDLTQGLTFYLFASAHPLDLTKHYYEITGDVRLPAQWAYGPWIWRDENEDQAQVVNDINTIRELDLATSGYWIDRPYASGVNSFDFNESLFPDPEAMVTHLHDQGFRLALWHCTYVGENQEATAELHNIAVEQNFYPDTNAPILNPWGRPIDLTNSDAYNWWQSNLAYYANLGVEGYKLDYVEDFVIGLNLNRLNWNFADGSTERTMHKYYQYLFHKVYAEMLPETGGFLLGRSATIGSQTLGTIIWPGDLDANFAEHRSVQQDRDGREYTAVGGLPAAVIAGLSLGPSGFPFFGSDTGGYRHAPPDKEVFTRWFQHTALSSIMQVGTNTNDVAWEFKEINGFDEEMLGWYRTYARLHLRLFPYAWTYAQLIQTTGRPITRPYGLQLPETQLHLSDVYFFGDDLLVAPVVARNQREKLVPFPNGTWFDWWTGEKIEGDQELMVSAPLSKLPLYLRGGGIIPMLRPTIDTLSPVAQGSDVESYANNPGRLYTHLALGPAHRFDLYDGTAIEHQVSDGTWRINIELGQTFTSGNTLILWGVAETLNSVKLNEVELELSEEELTDVLPNAHFDSMGRLVINLGPETHTVEVGVTPDP